MVVCFFLCFSVGLIYGTTTGMYMYMYVCVYCVCGVTLCVCVRAY